MRNGRGENVHEYSHGSRGAGNLKAIVFAGNPRPGRAQGDCFERHLLSAVAVMFSPGYNTFIR